MTKRTTKTKKNSKTGRDQGRFSAKRKAEAVLRMLRGETLDTLSREYGVTAAKLSEWQEAFVAAGEAGLKSRPRTGQDDQLMKLKAKVGELTMDVECYEVAFEMKGLESPFPGRRPKP